MDILELLNTQLGGPLMERLGSAVGLDAAQARSIGQAVLPAQVAALREKAGTEAGAQQLLGLVAQLPAEGVQEPLDTPTGLDQVRQSGTALLPQLLGSGMDDNVQQLATQTGASRSGVLGMMQMVLPLTLGTIGQQAGKLGLNAGSLGGLFSGAAGPVSGIDSGIGGTAAGLGSASEKLDGGVVGAASDLSSDLGAGLSKGVSNAAGVGGAVAGIGGAAAGLGSAVPGLGTAAGTPGAAGGDGVATVGAGAGLGGGVVHTNPALGGRRGMGWLWLLPLLLLVLLGGCFLLRGTPAAPFALTEPASGAAVSGAFALKGTGTAGHEVTVSENGQPIGKTTVKADGTFSAEVPAPSAGDHTYAVTESGGSEILSLGVKAAGAAATGTAAAGDSMAGMGKFVVTAPSAGASLPAGAFDLKGTGKAGEALDVFEDGVSLGNVTVGADGNWSLNVPSPAAGAHTYTVKGQDGTELGSFKTTTLAAAASTAACTKDFSLSIEDAQSVAQPFRFGGVGSGKSYTVTIMRGERKVGSKVLPLDATCSYSYTSRPGKGVITYMVAQTGSAEVASKITLNVR